jgi:PAS domain S-box-containing protein
MVTSAQGGRHSSGGEGAQWRELFEHSPVMYFMVDPAGTVLAVNAFGAAQLGYTVSELVGQSVLQVFFPDDKEAARKNLGLCVQTLGRENKWEIRKVRKDGKLIWVHEHAKALRRSDGTLIVLIACEDISQRKQAEAALRDSEQRFRDYAEIASDWVWETGPDHSFTAPNRGVIGELLGLKCWDKAADRRAAGEVARSYRHSGSPSAFSRLQVQSLAPGWVGDIPVDERQAHLRRERNFPGLSRCGMGYHRGGAGGSGRASLAAGASGARAHYARDAFGRVCRLYCA